MKRTFLAVFALVMLCLFANGQTVHHDQRTMVLGNGSFKVMDAGYSADDPTHLHPHQVSMYHSSKDFVFERFHVNPAKVTGVWIVYAITPTTNFNGEQLTSHPLSYLWGEIGVRENWSFTPWDKYCFTGTESGFFNDRGRWKATNDAPGGNPLAVRFLAGTHEHEYYIGASNLAPFTPPVDFEGPSAFEGHAGVPTFLLYQAVDDTDMPDGRCQWDWFCGQGPMNLSYVPRGYVEAYAQGMPGDDFHFWQSDLAIAAVWQSAPSTTATLNITWTD